MNKLKVKMKWKYCNIPHIIFRWMVSEDHRPQSKDHVNFLKQPTQETYQKNYFILFTIFFPIWKSIIAKIRESPEARRLNMNLVVGIAL